MLALFDPEPCDADCAPQLPVRSLFARDVHGLEKARFGWCRMRPLFLNQLSLDAPQLREVPPLLSIFAARQCLINHAETVLDLVNLAETHGKFAEEREETRQEARVAGAVEFIAEQGQACLEIRAPGHEDCVEGAGPQTPNPDCVALGMFE